MPWPPACRVACTEAETVAPRGGEQRTLHAVLRAATQDVHERLHRHPAFHAILTSQIDVAGYRALLARLAGFYAPFEISAGVSPQRTRRLDADLAALGAEPAMRAKFPRCPYIPPLTNPARQSGALYVVEGGALGGRQLAKALDALLGPNIAAGRECFLGRGLATGAAWHAFIRRIENFASNPLACAEIVAAAKETFATIERWLAGWNEPERAH